MRQKTFLLFQFVSIKYSIILILNFSFNFLFILSHHELRFSFLFLLDVHSIHFYPRSIYKILDFHEFIARYFNCHLICFIYFHEGAEIFFCFWLLFPSRTHQSWWIISNIKFADKKNQHLKMRKKDMRDVCMREKDSESLF